jgi:hypothetical protein
MNTGTRTKKGRTNKILWVAIGGIGVGILGLIALTLLTMDTFSGQPFNNIVAEIIAGDDRALACDRTQSAQYQGRERRWVWNAGDSVNIELGDVVVHYGSAPGNEIIATGSPTALAHIDIDGDRIEADCNISSLGQVDITLPGKSFRHIGINGPGHIEMEAVDQKEIDINITGPGTVEGNGKIDVLTVHITGPGEIKLADVVMSGLDANVVGPGTIEAGPKDKAHFSIIGPGTIKLFSHPPDLITNIIGPANISYAEKG